MGLSRAYNLDLDVSFPTLSPTLATLIGYKSTKRSDFFPAFCVVAVYTACIPHSGSHSLSHLKWLMKLKVLIWVFHITQSSAQNFLSFEQLMWPSIDKLWASLVVQTVKNLPAMQETEFRSLGREDPLEKEMATYSSILAWEIP